MRFMIISCLAVAVAMASPVRANPDSVPLLCGGSDVDAEARSINAMPTPGTYRCNDEGVTITLRITADGHFKERMVSDEPMFESMSDANSEAGASGMANETSLAGQWRVENGRLHLFARPQREPRIRLTEASRDTTVALRVEVRTREGQASSDLYVGEGEGANPRSGLSDGVLVVPAEDGAAPGQHWIVRTGDDLRLVSFDVVPGGNNSWRYVYEPSELEPFDQRALVVGDAVVVPLGIAGAVLRRVRDEP